jgi:hypothetical protein
MKRSIGMDLLSMMVVLIIVGVLLWLANTYIPMDSKIKTVLNIAVVVIVVLWLLKASGLLANLHSVHF